MVNRLLTLSEVARRTGVSRDTIRAWIDRGVLRSVAIGRRKRVPEAELMRLTLVQNATQEEAR